MSHFVPLAKTSLFSIITVCLNEPNIERTCESIVNQTFQDFEWIVIDGGSNAETLAIFEKYKSRMNYFVSESDGGIYFGMNKGIEQASGQWLNFMNAGDHFAQPDVLSRIDGFIRANPYCPDIIYGNYIICNEQATREIKTSEIIDIKRLFYTMPHHEASFIKKQLFDLHGYYDTTYALMADWDFCLKLATAQCEFLKVDIPILVYSQMGRSSTNKTQIFNELSRIRTTYFSQQEILSLKKEQAQQVRRLLQNRY